MLIWLDHWDDISHSRAGGKLMDQQTPMVPRTEKNKLLNISKKKATWASSLCPIVYDPCFKPPRLVIPLTASVILVLSKYRRNYPTPYIPTSPRGCLTRRLAQWAVPCIAISLQPSLPIAKVIWKKPRHPPEHRQKPLEIMYVEEWKSSSL